MGESVQNFGMRTRTRAGRGIWLNISILDYVPTLHLDEVWLGLLADGRE
jgi:hypothetical protein